MKLFSRSDFTIPATGISALESVTVGGVGQKLLIQTEKPGSPVLLFIHGGPSMPVPGTSNRGRDYALVMTTRELVRSYTVVFWDQRGTGKSYSGAVAKESMRIARFVEDAREVADYLRERFSQEKIHVAAHSWGTVIGLFLVHRYPERFHSYTGFSQIASWLENDRLSYQWVLEKARESNNRKALRELAAVGEPPYPANLKTWGVLRKWQFKHHSMFHDAGDKKSATFFSGLAVMLRSPDYSLADVFNSLVRGFRLSYTEGMLRDIQAFDFFAEVPRLEIPVLFIHGRQEKHVMPELIVRYCEGLDAPRGKKLLWSEKSSHAFHLDDARENEQRLMAFMADSAGRQAQAGHDVLSRPNR